MTVESTAPREVRIVLLRYGPTTPLDLANLMGWSYARAYRALRVLQADDQVRLNGRRYELTEKGEAELDGVTEWMEEE